MEAEPRCWLRARTSMSNSPPSFLTCSKSPTRTSRAGLAGWLLERMRWSSQALEACSRVLKKRAAQSHLSMRVPVMPSIFYEERLDGAEHAAREREERADKLECASYDDSDESERQQDQPDEGKENESGEGQGPAKESEKTEEQEVEHRRCSSPERFNAYGGEKVPLTVSPVDDKSMAEVGFERVVAVDWSGDQGPGQRKKIWAGVWTASDPSVKTGKVTLENGRTRVELMEWLVEMARETPRMVVGFDFSFGFPAWFMRELGIRSAPEFWRVLADGQGEKWLHKDCADGRFWGRAGSARHGKKPAEFCGEHAHRMLRRAETVLKVRAEITDPLAAAKIAGIAPKSVFQIGGAGAVGTASLRGMPGLIVLRDAGFRIWPFDKPELRRAPLVVEIYTRLMTGAVTKSSEVARTAYLAKKRRENALYGVISRAVMAKAKGSEDAFDALVTAMVMVEHRGEFARLRRTDDEVFQMEGQTWVPGLAED